MVASSAAPALCRGRWRPRECGEAWRAAKYAGCAGFGRERVGLTNDELQEIPLSRRDYANPEVQLVESGDGGTGHRV